MKKWLNLFLLFFLCDIIWLYINVRCNMLKSFLCGFGNGLLIVDGILFLLAAGLIVAHFIITSKKKNVKENNIQETNVSKVDDDTYLIETEKEEPVATEYENDNNVVHFVNQITDINEELNNELNANTVVVNHEVEQHVSKPVRKEEIANFVEVAGEKKVKTEEEIATSANRGTNAYKNATNFFNTIKTEQESDKMGSTKVSRR